MRRETSDKKHEERDGNGPIHSLAGKNNRNLPRAHLALTHAAPLYQHLLANAGEYKMSGKYQGSNFSSNFGSQQFRLGSEQLLTVYYGQLYGEL